MEKSTSDRIMAILPKLSEGDRVRVLQFAEMIIESRQGKRQQRQQCQQQSQP